MKKFLFIIKITLIILFYNSYSFAVVSTPTPTIALNKIANSMSHSIKNTSQNVINNNSATSKLINSSKLTVGIQESAAKYGLSIDSEAATILAGVDTSSSASISKAIAQLKSNVDGRGQDYIPTLDQDTIVYETEWFALKKVGAQSGENPSTMTNFDYATTNDVFTAGVEQMAKGKVYVNFQKGDVWSDIQLRLTLVQETNNAAANVQQAVSYTTEVGALALNDNGDPIVPVVAEDTQRISQTFGVVGTGFDSPEEGDHNTMKASSTTLQGSCCSGSWWDSAENRASEYNHDNDGGNQDAWESVFMHAKFTTASSEGGTAIGSVAIEGGHHDNNSEESAFVASIERHEASGTITGKAFEGN